MGAVLGKAHRCQHSQGQLSRQEQVECCGGKLNRVEIYACGIHSECAGDKTSWNRLRANSIRVKACHNCCDYTASPTT